MALFNYLDMARLSAQAEQPFTILDRLQVLRGHVDRAYRELRKKTPQGTLNARGAIAVALHDLDRIIRQPEVQESAALDDVVLDFLDEPAALAVAE